MRSISQNPARIYRERKFFRVLYLSDRPQYLKIGTRPSKECFSFKGSTASSDVLAAVNDIVKYTEEGKVAPALEFHSPVKAPNLPQICAEVGTGAVNALGGAKMADDDQQNSETTESSWLVM